jgi:hypothetical protein
MPPNLFKRLNVEEKERNWPQTHTDTHRHFSQVTCSAKGRHRH